MFKPGDKVRRINEDWGPALSVGTVCTVSSVDKNPIYIEVKETSGTYLARNFELVKRQDDVSAKALIPGGDKEEAPVKMEIGKKYYRISPISGKVVRLCVGHTSDGNPIVEFKESSNADELKVGILTKNFSEWKEYKEPLMGTTIINIVRMPGGEILCTNSPCYEVLATKEVSWTEGDTK